MDGRENFGYSVRMKQLDQPGSDGSYNPTHVKRIRLVDADLDF